MCCVMVMFLCTPFIYAQSTHVFSFPNSTDGTGTLKIDLEQYEIDSNGNRVVAQSKSVLPGEQVSYIPVIKNNGADCYVRLRTTIEMEDREVDRAITHEDLYGLGPNWKQIGEYLYYTKILRRGESIDAFMGVEVPHVWTQRMHESSGFTLYEHADAIQSENYTPNFNSDTPWEDAELKSKTDTGSAMPGGRAIVRTADDSMCRLWIALFICMISVALYSLWNRRG